MATASQIKMLIEAHVLKNEDRFNTVVLQLAAYEAKLGHTALARELRNILNKGGNANNNTINFNKDLSELISISVSNHKFRDLVLSDEIIERLRRLLAENQLKEKLSKFGLSNRRKILLEGPPGTGKTMSAAVIATEIGLPLCTIKMEKLMTKYMGETGAKLRVIFDSINDNRAVYFFDEFDAIGTNRNKDNDVGEVRRVLNLFLQFIEQDESESIIIAATNNFKLLDPALFRRFDDVIHYSLPGERQIFTLVINRLGQFSSNNVLAGMNEVVELASSLSHAELTKACDDAVKYTIMNDERQVRVDTLIKMIKEKVEAYS